MLAFQVAALVPECEIILTKPKTLRAEQIKRAPGHDELGTKVSVFDGRTAG